MLIQLPAIKKIVISSTSSGTTFITSTTMADITNMSLVINSNGVDRWKIELIPDNSTGDTVNGSVGVSGGATLNSYARIYFREGSTTLSSFLISNFVNPAPASSRTLQVPCGAISALLPVLSAGNHTIKMSYMVASATDSLTLYNCLIMAQELKSS